MAASLSWLFVFVLSLFTLVNANAADVRARLNERAACVSTATITKTVEVGVGR